MSDLPEMLETYAGARSDGFAKLAVDAAAEIRSLQSQLDKARAGLEQIFSVGDGWHPNTKSKPAGTTGEGHAKCREIAEETLAALSDDQEKRDV